MSLFAAFPMGAANVVVLRYGPLGGTNQVSAEDLEWQLALLSSGRRPVALSDVGLYLRGRSDLPRRGIAVTFDATDPRTLAIATEVLARHEVPATFFVAAGEPDGSPSENWEPLRALRGGRFDFGSRTVSGQALRGRPPQQVRDELLESRRRIEQMLEQPCLAVAYPAADDSDEVGILAEAGLAGYRMALSQREGLNVVGALEPFSIRRATVAPGVSRAVFQSALKLGRLG
jgi:peptidoglycan/xylan/chitin deacetylase (PgdA/CDA1 family)